MATRAGQQDSAFAERFARALETLRHRGPDAQGAYSNGNVHLGHTRLSILDLTSAGAQPMRSANGRFAISYNGEVYNFRELAREYGMNDLRSGADTEVVMRLFAEQGIHSLHKLNGMFAFAVHDAQADKLWLLRDRLGIKPLYYRFDASALIFASEIKAIAALNPDAAACNVAALHEWLYYGNPLADRTLHSGIKQLLPGHCLELDLNSFEYDIRPYWSLQEQVANPATRARTARDVIAETRRLLECAVQRQLVSDVPVGLFLSGGVDSSAIAAFASRHYEGRLSTYSAGFDFARDGGELPKAKRVAALFGTDHHEIHIEGGAVGDLVEKLVHQHDMPFSDAANIPLYLMAAKISGHTKVVLQGDGGDELFGGYRRYSTMSYYAVLSPIARVLKALSGAAPKSALRYRLQRYLGAFAAEDVATTMALLLTSEDRSLSPAAIFAPELRHRIERADPFARHRECREIFREQDLGNQMSFLDMLITLPNTFLEKVDRATMAASLEVRVPFLDNDLLDFVVRLPSRSKIPWGKKKWLLKSALEGVVPGDILHGPKAGLSVPFGRWLQGALRPLFQDHAASFRRRHPGVLDFAHIDRLFDQTSSGRRDDSYMLWKVLNLMIWANNSNVSITDGPVS
jgi:asparagine synthase (glutamine-hydrolysing)